MSKKLGLKKAFNLCLDKIKFITKGPRCTIYFSGITYLSGMSNCNGCAQTKQKDTSPDVLKSLIELGK